MNDTAMFWYSLGGCLVGPIGICLLYVYLTRVSAWDALTHRYGTTALGPENLRLGRASVGWWRGLVYAGSTPEGLFLEYPSGAVQAAFVPWTALTGTSEKRLGPFVRLALADADFVIFVHHELLPKPWPPFGGATPPSGDRAG